MDKTHRCWRRRARSGFAGLMVPLLPLAAVPFGLTASSAASAATPGLQVTGYQESGDPVSAIDASAGALSTVGVDGINLLASGRGVTVCTPQTLDEKAAAQKKNLKTTLLVSNWSNQINNFSEPLAHRMLSNQTSMLQVSHQLAVDVRNQGWNGITVDLESLTSRDTSGLVAFLRTLKGALPRGAVLSMDVTNFTVPSWYPGNGYDLKGIGRYADQVVLMAYDQHGPWEQTPGPVGALAWQRAGIKILLRSVPRSKLILGYGGYGYSWGKHRDFQFSDARAWQIVKAAGVKPQFKTGIGEWTATLPNGAVMWWADARSYALRVTMARQMGLPGLAVWDLALADPLTAAARSN